MYCKGPTTRHNRSGGNSDTDARQDVRMLHFQGKTRKEKKNSREEVKTRGHEAGTETDRAEMGDQRSTLTSAEGGAAAPTGVLASRSNFAN